jgi:hypothetical protein
MYFIELLMDALKKSPRESDLNDPVTQEYDRGEHLQ